MKTDPKILQLYVITDRFLAKNRPTIQVVSAAIAGGARIIQLREKEITTLELIEMAKALKGITAQAGAKLIINDRVDVALAVQADGVHLGDDDMPCDMARKILGSEKIIGKSVDTVADAEKAVAEGADYLGAGAVFATATKAEAPTIGITGLRAVCQKVNIPVVAIGGIKLDNVSEAIAAGAAGVAIVSGVVGANDITLACQEFIKQIELGKAVSKRKSGKR